MSKDPAFLFYSQDFYTGTRLMLPEERACYIDLLIYQHQNGYIPTDLKRVQMFCSGCSLEVVETVLNTKFNQVVNHLVNQKTNQTETVWLNKRLTEETTKRDKYRPQKVASGTFAGLISKSKLTKKQKEKIKKDFNFSKIIEKKGVLITDLDLIKSNVKDQFNQMVDHMVNNLENENENENENIIVKIKDSDFEEIKNVFNSVCKDLPSIQKITEKRKKSILNLAKKHNLETIGNVFKITSQSEFLNGNNKDNWSASFDWLLNPNNFLKVLEGNYSKNTTNNKPTVNGQTKETVETNLNNWLNDA
ncbi:DUF1376 domain-containing protein [Aurantibacter aestuarii]|uniref:DUF1376 domain-containing protein n=1 Tax=Aurantibacter aestuarii TaxID=1266046 RepID=A0A2T1NEP2_9FLAO|nr:DUF1376 domain-containing protein [Aurantibacter aestuarii]PSG90890.1 hypothetical protein C7H52_06350 [Aurantibacter aestuarii]